MPLCRVDGADIHYEVHGEGSPTLVLAYCLGGNCTMWQPQLPALTQRCRVVLWDPRGHGRSSSPADAEAYGITRSAEDLRALLDHLGIARAVVGGLSMGGGIATRFAMLYPERTQGLLIVDSNTAAGRPVPDATRTAREAAIRMCAAGDMDRMADAFIAANPVYGLFAGDTPENRKRVRDMIRAMNPVGFAHTLRAMLRNEWETADLARIAAPTCVLLGERDPAEEAARLTQRTIPGAELAIIPGAGHLSNIDDPAAVQAAILRFLERAAAA
ncbi:MAG: alpha/beta fold hydrolase [Alphaproteobacteria bacterium]